MTEELDLLVADGVIDEVLGRLKSGKEANISLVRRGDHTFAAKVYKDRATRSFKNNTEYKEGRKVRNTRTQRAMDSGGQFGRDAAEQEWKSAEADALFKLHGSGGVRVPQPIMFYEGVLLMELVKDAEGRPAPRLIDVAIAPEDACGVFADLVAQMIAMLCCDVIHGDLSPYNILAAADGPTIIDFPQVISAVHSSRAEYFFLRDFDNVGRFLAGFDRSLAVHRADGRAIWRAYVSRELTPQFVPPPPRPEPPPRRDNRPPRPSAPQRPNGPPRGNDGRPPQRGPRPSGPPRPGNDAREGRAPQRPGDHRTPPATYDARSRPPQPQYQDQRAPQRSEAAPRRYESNAPPRSGPPRPTSGGPRKRPNMRRRR
jgi:RIO kinase 1